MTEPAATPPSSVTIVDTVVGRRPGGHQEDYLAALEEALQPTGAQTIAPFRHGANAAALTSRWKRLAFLYRQFHKLTSGPAIVPRGHCLVFPSPDFIDFVVAFLAVRLRPRRPAALFLFVLRRSGSGIVGRDGFKASCLDMIVRSLARSGHLHPVSDSQSALAAWEAITGRPGSLVTIPIRQRPANTSVKAVRDPVVFGLAGLFRSEKGADHYGRVIETVVSLAAPVRIDVQLPDPSEDQAHPQAVRLRAEYGDVSSVRFLNGHLDNDAFTQLVSGIDVLVLPYDVGSYGTGTSGIMHEVLVLGGIVVSTRFTWAIDEYGDDTQVLWLDSLEPGHLQDKLSEARELALSMRKGGAAPIGRQTDSFRASWLSAINGAAGSSPAN